MRLAVRLTLVLLLIVLPPAFAPAAGDARPALAPIEGRTLVVRNAGTRDRAHGRTRCQTLLRAGHTTAAALQVAVRATAQAIRRVAAAQGR
jgi:hypothetical protein